MRRGGWAQVCWVSLAPCSLLPSRRGRPTLHAVPLTARQLATHRANKETTMAAKCKHWADMTKAEQAAVETLGWTNEARTQGTLEPPCQALFKLPRTPHRLAASL